MNEHQWADVYEGRWLERRKQKWWPRSRWRYAIHRINSQAVGTWSFQRLTNESGTRLETFPLGRMTGEQARTVFQALDGLFFLGESCRRYYEPYDFTTQAHVLFGPVDGDGTKNVLQIRFQIFLESHWFAPESEERKIASLPFVDEFRAECSEFEASADCLCSFPVPEDFAQAG